MIYGDHGYGGSMWGGSVAAVPQVQTFNDFYQADAWDIQEAAGDLFTAAWAAETGSGAYSASGAVTTARPNVRQAMLSGMTVALPLSVGGGAVALELAVNPFAYYTLEIVDPEGVKIGTLTTWNRGVYEANVGESARLSFTIPRSEPLLATLGHPNILVLRDRYGLVLDRFRARRSSEYNNEDGLFVDVKGRSLMDQLFREPVIDYAHEDTVQGHMERLLAVQVQDPPINLGAIDSAIAGYTVAIEAEVSNVLDIVRRIHEQLPLDIQGHFYISNNNQFRWRTIIGDIGRRLTMGSNLRGIRKSIDDEDLITELYMFGEGQDGDARPQVVVTRNVDLYGRIPYVKVDRRITKIETLTARANAIIDQFSTPRVTIEVDALDLAKADSATYLALGDYFIGCKYRVEDPAQAISEEMTVIGLTYDLDNPVAVKMKSASRNQTLADVFRGIQETIPASTDVNEGERWPNIQRTYDGDETDVDYRDGDLSYQDNGIKYRQLEDWVPITPTYVVDTEADLPEGNIPEWATARTRDNAKQWKRNQAEDGWEEAGGGAASDDPGEPVVAEDPEAGTSEEYARADHTHLGMPFIEVANEAALPTDQPNGVIAYSTDKALWIRVDGAWVNIALVYKATTKGGLPSGVHETAFGRVTAGSDAGVMYKRNSGNSAYDAVTKWE